MTASVHPAYLLQRPFAEALPIVVDSPHSGDAMPDDFRPVADGARLRGAQDAFVDRLFAGAPAQGAALLAARFPRAYIDPNPALADIDEDLLDERWPGEVAPSEKSRQGMGLVWRLIDGRPLY